jgi:hypothetical protein
MRIQLVFRHLRHLALGGHNADANDITRVGLTFSFGDVTSAAGSLIALLFRANGHASSGRRPTAMEVGVDERVVVEAPVGVDLWRATPSSDDVVVDHRQLLGRLH